MFTTFLMLLSPGCSGDGNGDPNGGEDPEVICAHLCMDLGRDCTDLEENAAIFCDGMCAGRSPTEEQLVCLEGLVNGGSPTPDSCGAYFMVQGGTGRLCDI